MNRRNALIVVVVLLAGCTFAFFQLNSGHDRVAQKIKDLKVLEVKDERLVIGDTANPLTIVEYADVLCPFCAVAHREIMPRITDEYIDAGKAHYEMRLVGVIRPESMKAAEGAYCAAEQDKFWDYIDRAYKETWENYYNQGQSPEDVTIFRDGELEKFVQRAGVDIYPWKSCMAKGEYRSVIESNKKTMTSLEGYGTPFFIFNDVPYGSGTPEYAVFKSALDAEYRKAIAKSSGNVE